MAIRNMPIEEYSEQDLVVRAAKGAGNGGFKPFKLTATLKRRALKKSPKNRKPRANGGAATSGAQGDP
jgi:hypothetical protein